ncbi:MAG: cob(I)yrinic acid a,c-diamide adenosyltransferase [Candidatus Omnitrophica bacterium]|nr:cob(I)yrinic acid a,c-diamide adenosyltransferase [Candidatus Omnitrophota bacterium]MBU4473301.1 cob(I)yrinic acid a,c-diamide adenosyltransferase [Candidatus Omnitrophota bacterium]MCG2706596.1 cob(I)yrinic acid a,c-diamide adenosyltransferase [Candidatus Omnitrophota bacterium]
MIQVYTGKGKGKTTAALGLAIRAAGAGLEVYICQFAKGMFYNELKALKRFKNIKVAQFGGRCFIKKIPSPKDMALARKGLRQVNKIISQKNYNMVILDEINIALKLKLVELNDVIELIKKAPKNLELILTGRGAHPAIIKLADLVSEIKDKKHYYKKGIKARKGIEF